MDHVHDVQYPGGAPMKDDREHTAQNMAGVFVLGVVVGLLVATFVAYGISAGVTMTMFVVAIIMLNNPWLSVEVARELRAAWRRRFR